MNCRNGNTSEKDVNMQSQGSKISIVAIEKIVVVAIVLLLINMILWSSVVYLREYHHRIRCGRNISALGKTMVIYACGYDDKYPTADKWCDLLLEYTEVIEKEFVCPSAGEGRCHYAMNPSTELTSSPDMVLLFETKGGWNQCGGVDILTFENHGGKGCNIFFNDYNVEFVKPEQLEKLLWKVEQRRRGSDRAKSNGIE
jgi:hypothetical protein